MSEGFCDEMLRISGDKPRKRGKTKAELQAQIQALTAELEAALTMNNEHYWSGRKIREDEFKNLTAKLKEVKENYATALRRERSVYDQKTRNYKNFKQTEAQNKALTAEISQLKEAKGSCKWFQENEHGFDPTDTWQTNCGDYYTIFEGTPAENKMKFCCFCGKPLIEKPFVPK